MLLSLALGEQFSAPLQPLALIAWTCLAMATSYAIVNPVIALALGVHVAQEAVSSGEWPACGVILAGMLLIFRGKTALAPQSKSNNLQ